jgi:Putative zinc-finger
MTCAMREWVGAYVLDALEPDEHDAVRRHIAGCTPCQDEVVSLAWIPPLLNTVQLEDVERIDTPLDARHSRVLEGLLATAAKRSRARRAVAVLGLAAALVTGGVALESVTSGSAAHPISVRTVDPGSHVAAAVTLRSHSWGTELQLDLHGVAPGEQCSLVVHGRDGQRSVAATWTASYRGTADVPGRTSIPTSQISALDVVTHSHVRLVHLTLPSDSD